MNSKNRPCLLVSGGFDVKPDVSLDKSPEMFLKCKSGGFCAFLSYSIKTVGIKGSKMTILPVYTTVMTVICIKSIPTNLVSISGLH